MTHNFGDRITKLANCLPGFTPSVTQTPYAGAGDCTGDCIGPKQDLSFTIAASKHGTIVMDVTFKPKNYDVNLLLSKKSGGKIPAPELLGQCSYEWTGESWRDPMTFGEFTSEKLAMHLCNQLKA